MSTLYFNNASGNNQFESGANWSLTDSLAPGGLSTIPYGPWTSLGNGLSAGTGILFTGYDLVRATGCSTPIVGNANNFTRYGVDIYTSQIYPLATCYIDHITFSGEQVWGGTWNGDHVSFSQIRGGVFHGDYTHVDFCSGYVSAVYFYGDNTVVGNYDGGNVFYYGNNLHINSPLHSGSFVYGNNFYIYGWADASQIFGSGYVAGSGVYYIAGVPTSLNSVGSGYWNGGYYIGASLTTLSGEGNGFWNGTYYLNGQITTLNANGNGLNTFDGSYYASGQLNGWDFDNSWYVISGAKTTLNSNGNGLNTLNGIYYAWGQTTAWDVDNSWYVINGAKSSLDSSGNGLNSYDNLFYSGGALCINGYNDVHYSNGVADQFTGTDYDIYYGQTWFYVNGVTGSGGYYGDHYTSGVQDGFTGVDFDFGWNNTALYVNGNPGGGGYDGVHYSSLQDENTGPDYDYFYNETCFYSGGIFGSGTWSGENFVDGFPATYTGLGYDQYFNTDLLFAGNTTSISGGWYGTYFDQYQGNTGNYTGVAFDYGYNAWLAYANGGAFTNIPFPNQVAAGVSYGGLTGTLTSMRQSISISALVGMPPFVSF